MLTSPQAFYTRKVKFTQETCSDKLGAIVESFPRLNDIHPFYKDLMNTLYDADHLKIALGQVSTAKTLIETVSRDYVRLLKYAGSLFQCSAYQIAIVCIFATVCTILTPSQNNSSERPWAGWLPSSRYGQS